MTNIFPIIRFDTIMVLARTQRKTKHTIVWTVHPATQILLGTDHVLEKYLNHLMFYVQSMAIKVLEKARFAEQKQSKINLTSIEWKQTWKDVRTVRPLPISFKKEGRTPNMCWTLNSGRKIVLNPAPEDRLQPPTGSQLKMTNIQGMQISIENLRN